MPSPFTYFAQIPNPPNDPGDDVINMQTNSGSINDLIAVDHVGFNNTIGGYHDVIHFDDQGSYPTTPAVVSGVGQLYTNTVTPTGGSADQQLFYESGLGVVTQLTGADAPLLSGNGYIWLPGGVLFQWGSITSTSSSFQTLLFATANINFPNACFNIWTQPFGSGTVASSQATVDIRKSTISNTSFQWVYVTNSGQYTGFFWAAIGN